MFLLSVHTFAYEFEYRKTGSLDARLGRNTHRNGKCLPQMAPAGWKYMVTSTLSGRRTLANCICVKFEFVGEFECVGESVRNHFGSHAERWNEPRSGD